MNIDNNNNNNWKTVGTFKKNKNKYRRKRIKKEKEKIQKEQIRIKEQNKIYELQKKRKNIEWRKQRIALIKEKEYDDFKSRQITKDFAQAIQTERSKANISRKNLALQLFISENELADYENANKCPSSQIVVKLRQIFDNLPRKYFK